MKQPDFTAECQFTSLKGGTISYRREGDDTGEILFEIKVPPGIHPARQYIVQGFVPEIEGLAVLWPASGVAIISAPEMEESGANPDFVVTAADRERRNLAIAINQAVEARVNALLGAQQAPSDSGDVIEDDDPAPQPAPAPEPAPLDGQSAVS